MFAVMMDRAGNPIATPGPGIAIAAALLLTIASAERVSPQPASWPPSPAPQQAEPEPLPETAPRKENPGLIDEIGKLLPTLKSPKETIDDAAEALSRLAKSPGVKGRVVCPPAPNGAPDCKAAADKLCQRNGFREGNSLDVDTTRNCSARSLLMGGKPDESECRTATYVTRAVCR
jgi:hypothetical protein